jgi:hypothetical protein
MGFGGAGEVFEGKAAIVTVPLGVLKAGAIRFEPALPPWKREAIGLLGFGDLNKVCRAPCQLGTIPSAQLLTFFVTHVLPRIE